MIKSGDQGLSSDFNKSSVMVIQGGAPVRKSLRWLSTFTVPLFVWVQPGGLGIHRSQIPFSWEFNREICQLNIQELDIYPTKVKRRFTVQHRQIHVFFFLPLHLYITWRQAS